MRLKPCCLSLKSYRPLGIHCQPCPRNRLIADAQGNVTLFRGLVRLPKPCSGNLSILLQVGPLVTEDRRPSRSCSKQSKLRCYGTYWMILRRLSLSHQLSTSNSALIRTKTAQPKAFIGMDKPRLPPIFGEGAASGCSIRAARHACVKPHQCWGATSNFHFQALETSFPLIYPLAKF